MNDMSNVLNVLIACEESQAICKEFRSLGHRAFSCDIQACSGGHPEWHIKGDASMLLDGDCVFQTSDSKTHKQDRAFLISWQYRVLLNFIKNGWVFEAEKIINGKEVTKKHFPEEEVSDE